MTLLKRRPIRSYVLRQGRQTKAQTLAFEQFWPRFGLDFNERGVEHWQNMFQPSAPCVLEIGFGMGDSLLAMAQAQPDNNFIGIEVHKPGVGRVLAQAAQLNLTNLKVIHWDAVECLKKMIPNQSLDKILVLFPDPWPKTKHHKRRLVQPDFVNLLAQKLKVNGICHMATDWQEYAEQMLLTLKQCPLLQNNYPAFAKDPGRIKTKFERRGENLGHPIFDCIFSRI